MLNCFARHCKLSLLTYPLDDKPFWSKLFGPKENIQPGAEVGKANGLTVLLDAETYDYTYHLRAGEGFKVNINTITFTVASLAWILWVPTNPSIFELWVPEPINFGNKGLKLPSFQFKASKK